MWSYELTKCLHGTCRTGARERLPGPRVGRAQIKLVLDGAWESWGFQFALCWQVVQHLCGIALKKSSHHLVCHQDSNRKKNIVNYL